MTRRSKGRATSELYCNWKSLAFLIAFLVPPISFANEASTNLEAIVQQMDSAIKIRIFALPLTIRSNSVQESDLLSRGCQLTLSDDGRVKKAVRIIREAKPSELATQRGWEPLNGIYLILPGDRTIKILLGQAYAQPHEFRFGTISVELPGDEPTKSGSTITRSDGSFDIVKSTATGSPISVNKNIMRQLYLLATASDAMQMEAENCSSQRSSSKPSRN